MATQQLLRPRSANLTEGKNGRWRFVGSDNNVVQHILTVRSLTPQLGSPCRQDPMEKQHPTNMLCGTDPH